MNNMPIPSVQPRAPAAFLHFLQFCVWILEDGDKRPYGRGWKGASWSRPGDLMSYAEAEAMAATNALAGVGFFFLPVDPFWFIDIDHCRDKRTGELSLLAQHVLGTFPGCATEVSQSGTGVHLFGCGMPAAHRCRNVKLGLELYTQGRFVALTGMHQAGDARGDYTTHLAAFQDRYDMRQPEQINGEDALDEGPVPGASAAHMNDLEVMEVALKAKSLAGTFGGKATPAQIWHMDIEALIRTYPEAKRGFDHSAVDQALLTHLAFFTGRDQARMHRIFKQWPGYRPDKYDRRPRLLAYNSRKAVVKCANVYDRRKAPGEVAQPVAPAADAPAGWQPQVAVEGAYPGDPYAAARASAQAVSLGALPPPAMLRDFGQLHTLDAIVAMDLPEPTFLVDGLIPPGMLLLIGKPKKGKSWMVMDLCLNVAIGDHFLGRKCQQGKVIYFALEDNQRRIKSRMLQLMPRNFTVGSNQLKFATVEDKIENMDRGFFDSIRHTLKQNPDTRLLAIDTLSCVRPVKKGNEGLYDYDRRCIDPFTQLCAEYPLLTILIVHHSRKSDSEDPMDMASGTTGLTGAVDGTFVIGYDHQKQQTILYGKGRDIEDIYWAVKLDMPKWIVLGDPDEVGMNEGQRKILEMLAAEGKPMTMTEIMAAVDIDKSNAQYRLGALVKNGRLRKNKDKTYMLDNSRPVEGV